MKKRIDQLMSIIKKQIMEEASAMMNAKTREKKKHLESIAGLGLILNFLVEAKRNLSK